ncbi:MAG: DUF2238 domain-containing protein, partial [Gemmatimonadota bacterium]
MLSTSTSHREARFRRRRLLQGLALWYGLAWIVLAIRPLDRHDWLLENILVALVVELLVGSYRAFPLSDLSYLLIAVFLTLHAIGA